MSNIFPLSERLVAIVFIDNNYDAYQDSQKNVYIVVNLFWNHPLNDRSWQRERPTATPNVFLSSECLIVVVFIDDNNNSDQDTKTHVSIIGDSFDIILESIGQHRRNIVDVPHQPPTAFNYLNFCYLCVHQ